MNLNLSSTAKELHSREHDGIHVQLLWTADDDRVWVSVYDSKTSEGFAVEVRDRSRALDVFHHPYAYAPVADPRPAAVR
jgi:hypothetical protein